jgi:hypothetical protein
MDVSVAIALGRAMCEAWGLNPADVRAIDLHWRPHTLPWADVEMWVAEGVVREVLRLAPVQEDDRTYNPNEEPLVGGGDE